MKKLLNVLIAVFLLVPSVTWADVSVQADANGTEATVQFTFKAPKADKVNIAGTMNGWNMTATALEKGADGVWTYTIKSKTNEVFKYKFVVDGAWTFDENAPDSENDGYGGSNGVVDVAQLLKRPRVAAPTDGSAPAPAPVAEGPKMQKLGFSTWSRVTLDGKSLTKNVKDKTVDGYDFDALSLRTESYWKLSGDILPGVNLYTELNVANGTLPLYQANTLGSSTPITTPADGLANAAGLVFNPFYTLNSGANPTVGHFKVKFVNDWFTLFTGYNNSKGTSHAFLWNTSNYDDNNAGPGFTEVSLGKAFSQVGDGKLEVVVAPNKISGYGVYSWATYTAGDLIVDASVNAKSGAASVYQFHKDYKSVAVLGASQKFGDFTVKAGGLANFGPWTPNLSGGQWLDNLGASVQTGFYPDGYGVALNGQVTGKDTSTIYGKDGDLHAGNVFVELKPWTKIEMVKVGFDSNVTLTNKFDQLATSDTTFWTKPYADADLSSFVPLKLSTSLYGNVNVDLKGGKDWGTKLNEVGIGVTGNDLMDGLNSLTISNAVHINYNDWDSATKSYTAKKLYDIVIAQASLQGNVNLSAGGQIQALNADKATETEKKQLAPVGAFAGVSWVVPSDDLKKPVAYLSFTYNMDPYDDGKDGLKLHDTDKYRPDSIDNGYGESHLRLGLIWSF